MVLHLLEYRLADDYLQRRDEFRAAHLALLREAHARGELVMAGALTEPADRSLLVWAGPREAIEAFVGDDPYVTNGLVLGLSVRDWNVVVSG